MAKIEIRQDPQSGQVTLVLTGAPQDERRFRLKDTLTNKYLTRRGWSGKAVYLPGDAIARDQSLELTIDPEMAAKITAFATLVLEAPSAAFSMNFVWRPKLKEADDKEFELDAVPDLLPIDASATESVVEGSEPGAASPLISEQVDVRPAAEEKYEPQSYVGATPPRSILRAVLIAAVFLLFGFGAGYALFADATSAKKADTPVVAAQDGRKDLETELKKANDKIAELNKQIELVNSRAQLPPDQRSADLSRQLDAAKKALAERENEIEALKGDQTTQTASTDTEQDWQERLRRAEEERDLYSQELQTLTTKFAQLQKEKAALESAGATASAIGRAIWGAAAIDEGGTIYALQNQTVEKAAKDNVNAVCRGKSSFRCIPLTSYKNACLSVARFAGEQPSPQNYGFAINADWKQAEENALDQCRQRGGNCVIRFTACAPDTLSKPVSE